MAFTTQEAWWSESISNCSDPFWDVSSSAIRGSTTWFAWVLWPEFKWTFFKLISNDFIYRLYQTAGALLEGLKQKHLAPPATKHTWSGLPTPSHKLHSKPFQSHFSPKKSNGKLSLRFVSPRYFALNGITRAASVPRPQLRRWDEPHRAVPRWRPSGRAPVRSSSLWPWLKGRRM